MLSNKEKATCGQQVAYQKTQEKHYTTLIINQVKIHPSLKVILQGGCDE